MPSIYQPHLLVLNSSSELSVALKGSYTPRLMLWLISLFVFSLFLKHNSLCQTHLQLCFHPKSSPLPSPFTLFTKPPPASSLSTATRRFLPHLLSFCVALSLLLSTCSNSLTSSQALQPISSSASVFTIKQPKTLKLCFELVCPSQPHGSCKNCFLSAAFEADCKSRHAHIYVSSNFLQVKKCKAKVIGIS